MQRYPLELDPISDVIRRHKPSLKKVQGRGHASVAMLLRQGDIAPEALFIIRAKHEQDPWSGNIGFPGGRLDDKELPRQAAERETLEELSFNLECTHYLGQLDDLYGAIMPVLVSCFIYRVPTRATLQPNHEIESYFWCPLPKLLEQQRHQLSTFFYRQRERTHPVVKILDEPHPLLWGITYRLVSNFFDLCGYDFGIPENMNTVRSAADLS